MQAGSYSAGDFPLVIAQVDTPQEESGGDFYYRTYAPGVGMAHCEAVHVLNFTYVHRHRIEIMHEADVLILNNICCPDLLPVIKRRRSEGKLTVYELCDDLNDVPKGSRVHAFYQNPENTLLLKRLARSCDAMQFSSPELQRKYGFLNPVSRVFPNHILDVPPERMNDEKRELIVGWGGSIGHFEDLAQYAAPLMRWISSRNDVRLHLMCGDAVWNIFAPLPDRLRKRTHPGSLSDYYRFVNTIEIGIAPLKDTPFNRSRSDVKFLEYAVHGTIPVLQAAGPYPGVVRNGETGFLFNTQEQFISILATLADNPSLRKRISGAARNYVLKERLQLDHGQDRVAFYRQLLGYGHAKKERRKSTETVFARFASTEGAKVSGRHALLQSTRFEHLMNDGMTAGNAGRRDQAGACFLEASQLEPRDYMPRFCGCFFSESADRALERCLELNPESIRTWMARGELAAGKGNLPLAMEYFRTAMEIFPTFELPYIKCAVLLREAGYEKEASELMIQARKLAGC